MKIRICKKQGIVLVSALIIGGIVGLTLASYLIWAANHNTMMRRSYSWNDALPVLEAGIEEALSHANVNSNQLTADGWKLNDGIYSKTRYLDTNSYCDVTFTAKFPPVIVSKGFVKAPLQSDQYLSRTVIVTTANRPRFVAGFATRLWIDLNGASLTVDSYDSTDPKYSTGGKYDPTKKKDNGNVATNLGLTNSINDGNAKIYGKLDTGPGGTVKIGAQGRVGSTAFVDAAGSANDGKVQDGYLLNDMNAEYPPITDCPKTGLKPIGGKVAGVSYQYLLGNGTYIVSDVSSSIYISGNATLVISNKLQITGSDKVTIAPGGSLTIYNFADDAKFGGGGIVNPTDRPVFFQYYGMPSNKSLNFSGGSTFTGAVYAPDTDFDFGGNGGFFGSSITRTLKFHGKVNAHFDESLGKVKPLGFAVNSWNEI